MNDNLNTNQFSDKRPPSLLQRDSERGFSLVELMVVITIIGILAGIAIPKFQTFRARAQQTEAKSGLNAVFLSAQAFEANYGDYPVATAAAATAALPQIGFAAGGNRQRYSYSFASQAEGWAAYAVSNVAINGATDYFRINTNKWLCQPFDAVINLPGTEETAAPTALTARGCPQVVAGGAAGSLPAFVPAADCALGAASCGIAAPPAP